MIRKKAKRKFKCLRCGISITLDKGSPDENMGGKCLGHNKGKHWWTGA
ncbi:MAG: hypothetical protein KJ955_04820 [Nanoarchaeota archaeon]|nr:hypothetical protein [Nanoarchaeota archaeon]